MHNKYKEAHDEHLANTPYAIPNVAMANYTTYNDKNVMHLCIKCYSNKNKSSKCSLHNVPTTILHNNIDGTWSGCVAFFDGTKHNCKIYFAWSNIVECATFFLLS